MTADAPFEPGAGEVLLRMTLPAGQAYMKALSVTRDGDAVGTSRAYVKKL